MIDCEECDGTGEVCAGCGNPEVACICIDGATETVACSECDGDGEIPEEGDEVVDSDDTDDEADDEL